MIFMIHWSCYIRWLKIIWSNWKFSFHIYLHASTLYAIYLNLYLFLWFFFMFQHICTCCAYNHLIYNFFNSNSTYVLNLCLSLFINLPVYSYTLYASYMLISLIESILYDLILNFLSNFLSNFLPNSLLNFLSNFL